VKNGDLGLNSLFVKWLSGIIDKRFSVISQRRMLEQIM
jgi:hypothetical protein